MKLWNLTARFLSLFLLILSCLLSLCDGLQIDWWNLRELLIICGIVAFCVILIYYNKISAGIGIMAVTAFEAWIFLSYRQQLLEEFLKCRIQVVDLINQYYRTDFPLGKKVLSEDSQIFIFFVAVLLGIFTGIGIVWRKWRFFSMLPPILSFLCGMLLGYAPGIGATVCLICGFGMQLLIFYDSSQRIEQKTRVLGAICLGTAIFFTIFIYRPIGEELLKHHSSIKSWQLSMEDRFLTFVENSRSYDFLRWRWNFREQTARLSNHPPELSEEVIFEITMGKRPNKPIYLKTFTGDIYDNGTWSSISEDSFRQFSKQQNREETAYGTDILTKSYEYLKKTGEEPEHITIHVLKHNGNLSPFPYCSSMPDNAAMAGDSGIRVTKGNTYQFLGYTNYDLRKYLIPDITIQPSSSGEELVYDEAYQMYVDENYKQLPDRQLLKLKNQLEEAICNLELCSYSMDLSPVPGGWDVVEYFLFEQRKGYCMHFASANVLLLRIMGEPARYASGYLVLPQDFTKNESGEYTARVRQKRAHAWVEIYYGESMGWMPLEVTPDSYYQSLLHTDAADTMKNEKKQQQEEMRKPEQIQQTRPDEDIKKEKHTGARTGGMGIAPKILFVILLMAGLILGNYLRLKFIRKRKKQRFWNKDINEGAKAILQETIRILSVAGIELKDTENELDFARNTEKMLGYFAENEFVKFIELARQVRYSSHRLTEEQQKYLYMVYDKLRRELRRRLKWYQKLWYCYLMPVM